MSDIYITGKSGSYRLTERTFDSVGGPPDYRFIKNIGDAEAYMLQNSGVFDHLYGHDIENPKPDEVFMA